MGVEIVTNTMIGKDIPFETVRKEYDAVLLGIGAWISTGVGCKGEDAEGVIGGIDFLRKVVRNEPIELGKKVAIVGGGNTAVADAIFLAKICKKVYLVHRRDELRASKTYMEALENTENIEIYVGYNYYIDNQIKLYSLNEFKFNEAYNILKNNELKINNFKENKINASINAKKDMTVYTSIPFDNGWKVYIDNKKVDTFKIGNTLLGFDTTKGNHNITLIYKPNYLKTVDYSIITEHDELVLQNIIKFLKE
jgi:NADPH-dependent glutamate synthase beta subunit-like oxidoreductase